MAEKNLLPHSEQRKAEEVLLGGDDGDDVSVTVFSAT